MKRETREWLRRLRAEDMDRATHPATDALAEEAKARKLRKALQRLVDLHVRNPDTRFEFIAFKGEANWRNRKRSESFQAFKEAQRVLKAVKP